MLLCSRVPDSDWPCRPKRDKRRIRKRAENNDHLVFGDFEVGYLIGNGKDFDWGTDYLKCGNYKFVKSQGVEEFAPYVCLSDMALGKALGWGLIRTETLADGCDKCDFRFKKGAGIQISSKTPEVQKTIEKIMEEQHTVPEIDRFKIKQLGD